MINEKGAGGGYFTVPLYEKNFGSEVSGDFTLPDYYTEIRRILCVTPTVLPPAKYVGDNTAEFNGVIDYTVTYVGGDGEIYSIPLSSDYSFNLPIERIDGAEDVSALCSVGVESVNTRVSAPRRLSIRSRISPNVRIYAKLPSDVGSEVDVAVNGIHTRASQVQSLTCQSVSSDILEVNYIHPNLSDDVRVLRADSNVLCERTEITDTGVRCFATLKLTFLISHSDGSVIETVTGEAPFDGEIDIDGGLSDAKIRVRGMVSEMSVNVTDQGIECKAGIILEGNVLGNKNVSYTDDIYSTQDTCDCEMKRISVRRCVACSSGSFSFGERFPMDTLGGNDASIYMTLGSVTMDKCEAKGDKYVLSGNALFDLLCRKDGELQMIQVIAPVRYEAETFFASSRSCSSCRSFSLPSPRYR